MGFGIMFLGFFFLYIGAITPLNVFTAIIGSAIILLSLKELVYQNKLFMPDTKIKMKFCENIFTKPIAKYTSLWYNTTVVNKCWCGSMAEQRYRKPQVAGSTPVTSSIFLFINSADVVQWQNFSFPS